MGTILRTGDVMEIKPASVFEVNRLGSILLSKPNRYSLLDLQKTLKKIYVNYYSKISKTISKDSTKLVAGSQGMNLGEFSGPSSHSAPACSDIHTCIPKNAFLARMILRLHLVPVDAKKKKFKGTFRDASIEMNNEADKKLGVEYFAIESSEGFILEQNQPFLFILVHKKQQHSMKEVELSVFSCICETQAKDIIKALEGELLEKESVIKEKIEEKISNLEIENEIKPPENTYADIDCNPSLFNALNSNIYQTSQTIQEANLMSVYNPYALNDSANSSNSMHIDNMYNNPYALDNSKIISPQSTSTMGLQAISQQNPYSLQQPYQLQQPITNQINQQQRMPLAVAQIQPQFPIQDPSNQQNIFNGQYPPLQLTPQQMQFNSTMSQGLPPQNQEYFHSNIQETQKAGQANMAGQFIAVNRQIQPAQQQINVASLAPTSNPQIRQRAVQPNNAVYGKDYYNQNEQTKLPQQNPVIRPAIIEAATPFAEQKRQNFSNTNSSINLSEDQVFSPPINQFATLPTPKPSNPNMATTPMANDVYAQSPPVFSPTMQFPQPAGIPPQRPVFFDNQQQPVRNVMLPSPMIMGSPFIPSNSSSLSTPSTGEPDVNISGDVNTKPVALVQPRKIRGIAVLPFTSPQTILQTPKTSETDPEKKEQKGIPPPIKSKPFAALQKPTLIDKTAEKPALEKAFSQEKQIQENVLPSMDLNPVKIENQALETQCIVSDEKIQDAIQDGLGYLP